MTRKVMIRCYSNVLVSNISVSGTIGANLGFQNTKYVKCQNVALSFYCYNNHTLKNYYISIDNTANNVLFRELIGCWG